MQRPGPWLGQGSFSDGRDIGVVFNMPSQGGATVLPSCGGVGAQYTPAAGWAKRFGSGAKHWVMSLTAAVLRSFSVATLPLLRMDFWSALTIATTQRLPMLFYVEDKRLRHFRFVTIPDAGRQYCSNLRSFAGLTILRRGRGRPTRSG